MVNLEPGLAAARGEIEAAIARVISSGAFVAGPDVRAFEQEMARYLGVRHCVGVNSGTDALVIALRALGIGAGDEVIVPAFTFVASAEAVCVAGATPVFADIEPDTYTLDAQGLDALLTNRTRAILAVHLFGQGAEVEPLMAWAARRSVRVIEDVAQALGASYQGRKLGSFGVAAALSFFPSKNLGALGDAGMLATSDDDVADLARRLRQHGGRDKYSGELLGYNSRLDSIQAAVLRTKLPRLDDALSKRRAAARRYDALLAGVPELRLPAPRSGGEHTYHQYTLALQPAQRSSVAVALEREGIQSMIYYPAPLYRLPAYRAFGNGRALPNAEASARSVLSIPIWPEISVADQERVAGAVKSALGTR
jgi:dTDP-4-amino-4,6-dideoxygalactose transaminase